jgi:hypothetical protein
LEITANYISAIHQIKKITNWMPDSLNSIYHATKSLILCIPFNSRIRKVEMKRIILLFIALLFVTVGCQPKPAPKAESETEGPPFGNLVLDKEFNEPSEPWCDGGSYSFGDFYCQDGEFHIVNKGADNIATMTAGNFKDFRLLAQMRSVDESGSYGVAFRGQDASASYYIFRIRPEGQYQLIKWSPDKQDKLIAWTDSTTIKKGQSLNQLEVIAQGTQISLSVNNEQLANIMDTSFADGSVGPVATEDGHAVVSMIKVWQLYADGDLIRRAEEFTPTPTQ